MIKKAKAAYLGKCNAHHWNPTDDGLLAFVDQMRRGFRDGDGEIVWGPEQKNRPAGGMNTGEADEPTTK